MRRWISLLILFLSLSGCTYYAPPEQNHPVRVVTQIDITATNDDTTENHTYTDNAKMEVILHYLRNLQPDKSTPITPDTFRADTYEIRLTMSDGTQTVYRQIYDEYLQRNGGRWHTIDKTLGSILPKILDSISSDTL